MRNSVSSLVFAVSLLVAACAQVGEMPDLIGASGAGSAPAALQDTGYAGAGTICGPGDEVCVSHLVEIGQGGATSSDEEATGGKLVKKKTPPATEEDGGEGGTANAEPPTKPTAGSTGKTDDPVPSCPCNDPPPPQGGDGSTDDPAPTGGCKSSTGGTSSAPPPKETAGTGTTDDPSTGGGATADPPPNEEGDAGAPPDSDPPPPPEESGGAAGSTGYTDDPGTGGGATEDPPPNEEGEAGAPPEEDPPSPPEENGGAAGTGSTDDPGTGGSTEDLGTGGETSDPPPDCMNFSFKLYETERPDCGARTLRMRCFDLETEEEVWSRDCSSNGCCYSYEVNNCGSYACGIETDSDHISWLPVKNVEGECELSWGMKVLAIASDGSHPELSQEYWELREIRGSCFVIIKQGAVAPY